MEIIQHKFLLILLVAITELCSIAFAHFVSHGCFPLEINECDIREFGYSCTYFYESTPKKLQLNLSCKNGERIEVTNVTYSMPALPSLTCSNKDKGIHCNNINPCYCCTVIDQTCEVDSDIDEISRKCNNVNNCSVTVSSFWFNQVNCPSYALGDKNCNNNQQNCQSRWIDVQYMCCLPRSNVNNVTCVNIQSNKVADGSKTDTKVVVLVVVLGVIVILLIAVVVVLLAVILVRRGKDKNKKDNNQPCQNSQNDVNKPLCGENSNDNDTDEVRYEDINNKKESIQPHEDENNVKIELKS